MPTKTEVPIVEKLYRAYLKASNSTDSRSSKEPFICGLQAGMWFFEVLKDHTSDPTEAALSFLSFKKEVRKEYDKLNMAEVRPDTN